MFITTANPCPYTRWCTLRPWLCVYGNAYDGKCRGMLNYMS